MSLDILTSFFGWMTLINVVLITFTALVLIFAKNTIVRTHQIFFSLTEENLEATYFRYLANYKLAVLVFNLVPYIALLCMS
ncbi:DUF6868 family protein [Thalassotalea euphylliae]|uniref:DUF6868 family protein n=1 Tax=Thalassotalea euphylliae TaxID=1655234 RepID=UPI00362C1D72